jgi:hypothetical protein
MQQTIEFEFTWWRDRKGYALFDPSLPEAERPPVLPGWHELPKEFEEVLRAHGVVPDEHGYLPDSSTLPQWVRPLWSAAEQIPRWPSKQDSPLTPELFNRQYQDDPEPLPHRIHRLAGELDSYQPLDAIDDIFKEFINLPQTKEEAPSALCSFVNKFGSLTRNGHKHHGESVHETLALLRLMNLYIDARLSYDDDALRKVLGEGAIGWTGIVPLLSYDPATRSPRLRFAIPSLQAALWLHMMQSFSAGASIRRCEWCNLIFETGAGTGRRADAKFCCDAHRTAYHSIHRTPRRALDKEQPRRPRGRPRKSPAAP